VRVYVCIYMYMFNSPQEMCSSSRFKPTIAGVAMYTMISLWLKICFQQPGEKHQNLFLFENSICCYATWNIKVEHQRYFISNPGSIMLPELASIPSPISLHVRAYIHTSCVVYLWIALWVTPHCLRWKLTKLTTLP